jgi:hypothetical protein
LLTLALVLALLAAHARAFANWLILGSLGLSLLPACFMATVLLQRMRGAPAELAPIVTFTQGTNIIAQAVVCTVAFACAVALGWMLRSGPAARIPQPGPYRSQHWSPVSLGVILAVWAFAVFSFNLQSGGSILTAGFVINAGHAILFSGMWMPLASFCLLLLEVGWAPWNRVALHVLSLLWLSEFAVSLLHGDRADLIAGCIIVLCCRVRGFRRQMLVVALGSLIAVPALTFFAVYRQLAASGMVSVGSMISRAESNLSHLRDLGDLGDLSITTTSGLYMVESGRRPLAWGGSYDRYLFRLAPTALRPPDPADGQLVFRRYGFDTIGGMTPVSEAYFNFGFLGPALIGFVHGWIIAWLYAAWLQKRTTLWTCIYFLAAAYTVRAYFYDTFDLIKAEFVMLILFAGVAMINWVSGQRGVHASPSSVVA